jgi:hypothetical protein
VAQRSEPCQGGKGRAIAAAAAISTRSRLAWNVPIIMIPRARRVVRSLRPPHCRDKCLTRRGAGERLTRSCDEIARHRKAGTATQRRSVASCIAAAARCRVIHFSERKTGVVAVTQQPMSWKPAHRYLPCSFKNRAIEISHRSPAFVLLSESRFLTQFPSSHAAAAATRLPGVPA